MRAAAALGETQLTPCPPPPPRWHCQKESIKSINRLASSLLALALLARASISNLNHESDERTRDVLVPNGLELTADEPEVCFDVKVVGNTVATYMAKGAATTLAWP